MCRARALPPRTVESVAAAADGDGDDGGRCRLLTKGLVGGVQRHYVPAASTGSTNSSTSSNSSSKQQHYLVSPQCDR